MLKSRNPSNTLTGDRLRSRSGNHPKWRLLSLSVAVSRASSPAKDAVSVQSTARQTAQPTDLATKARISHATNFHLVLHAVYKNPPEAKVERLQLLEELTLQRLDELNVDSLITVMFAFARSRYLPHLRIQQRMAIATEADMASFTPRQLEHAAVSLAAVRYRPSDVWLVNFAHAVQVNWEGFRPPQLATTLVQAAACGLTRLPDSTLADQMPALLRRLTSSAMEPGTLAKLVWSAGHFEPLTERVGSARPDAGGDFSSDAQAPIVAAVPGDDPAAVRTGPWVSSASGSEEVWVRSPASVLPEREVLVWWEGEGTVEAAEPGDLVLLLNGLARLGVRPGPGLTQRVLAAVMGSQGALAQLPPPQLGLLAWSTLKLADEPPRREWVDGLVAALRCHIREPVPGTAGSGAGSGWVTRAPELRSCTTESSVRIVGSGELVQGGPVSESCLARPTDVALVLSSLPGLGGDLSAAAHGEFRAYWRSESHWAELSREDRVVMSLLGYGPVPD